MTDEQRVARAIAAYMWETPLGERQSKDIARIAIAALGPQLTPEEAAHLVSSGDRELGQVLLSKLSEIAGARVIANGEKSAS